MVVPLIDLVGMCGQTKMNERMLIKERLFYWNKTHQTHLVAIENTTAYETLLA